MKPLALALALLLAGGDPGLNGATPPAVGLFGREKEVEEEEEGEVAVNMAQRFDLACLCLCLGLVFSRHAHKTQS